MSSVSFGSRKALPGKHHRDGTQGKADKDIRGDVEGAFSFAERFMPINPISDPGDAAAIPVLLSGYCYLTSGGAETRTLADPQFDGQVLNLSMDVDGGDIVITAASNVSQAASTSLTFADAGDHLYLVAIQVGGALKWRIMANDGVALA